MKKLSLIILSLLLLILLFINIKQFFPQTNSSLSDKIEPTTTLVEQTTSETSTETTRLLEETTLEAALFNEEVLEGNYPSSSRPEVLSSLNVLPAIEEYFIANYSQEDIDAASAPLANQDKANLLQVIQEDPKLAGLEVDIDSVALELGGEQLIVPRIIVLQTYQQAEATVPGQDAILLTHAMTHLGNRLVMISYYDPATQVLTTYHLTNWTSPLFSMPSQ